MPQLGNCCQLVPGGGFPGGASGTEPACQCRRCKRRCKRVWSLGWEDPVEEGMATPSSILAWRIPWTEEPGGLQSTGSQSIRHDWSDLAGMEFASRPWALLGFACCENSADAEESKSSVGRFDCRGIRFRALSVFLHLSHHQDGSSKHWHQNPTPRLGLPWQSSGWDSELPMLGRGFNPWLGN